MKHNNKIIIRIPTETKDKLQLICDADLMTLSGKIRQLVLKEIRDRN